MDRSKNLILKNGKDITGDVILCKYNQAIQKYDITFQSGKTYSCGYHTIKWLRDPKILAPALARIIYGDELLFNIDKIYVFPGAVEYWHIHFLDGREKTYERRELKIIHTCLDDDETKKCFNYLQSIASVNDLKGKDGEILLKKQYEKLNFIGNDTAMAVYLNPKKNKVKSYSNSSLIFPFGGNASQFQAVRNALTNQISVIQGPPGTGKTQTILNIIANLLIAGKTIQVVSNNNSATRNIFEKLSECQYNLGFIAALLGNRENKDIFIENQTGCYPDLSDWKLDKFYQDKLRINIEAHTQQLLVSFDLQERLSQLHSELDSLNIEKKHFEQYCDETGFVYPKIKQNLDSRIIMRLWQECCIFSEKQRGFSLWFKIKCVLIHHIANWKFYKNNLSVVITLFQKLFFEAKKHELGNEIAALKKQLQAMDAERKMKELTKWSLDFLRAQLCERYGGQPKRRHFSEDDLWKKSREVIREYPVILSTTFSSCSSLRGITYDYLIIDEASQVDVVTGALALSCANNAVIVGDLKQLPNVVTNDMKAQCDVIFNSYKLPLGYSFSENSFLKSICDIMPDVPQTLLREHYRCHPKIIGFCNQKFYNNKLIIMTEDHNEPDTLAVFKTAIGNHRREHINQRQIDVTLEEIIPLLNDTNMETTGIIAPYKKQINVMGKQLNIDKIEVDTVHKFQGREKDTIVLTTVDDIITKFSDDPYLLNVAISRAKKKFILVVSGNEQPSDSNINDLISYIEYNNGQIIQSEIYSVFDLLYRQYTNERIAFLNKHPPVSTYDSENVMYGKIVDMLNKRRNLSLNVICHLPLNLLIRDKERINTDLNADEYRYVMNLATHVDFLIYNQISRKPVLVIEVDGYNYHKPGTKQYKRDRMKDNILKLYAIPFLRLPTNGSGEYAKISKKLDEYSKTFIHKK